MVQIDRMHDRLIKELIDKGFLAKHLELACAKQTDFYPVLVGGVNIKRCASLEPKAKRLLGKLGTNDIDISFVVSKFVRDNSDPIVQTAHSARLNFLTNLLYDPEFVAFVKQFGERRQTAVMLSVNMPQPVFEFIERVKLTSIIVKYKNADCLVEKGLIDTTIISNYADKTDMLYPKYIGKALRDPIPYIMMKNLPFATCNFIFYDTVRVLSETLLTLHDGSNDQRKQLKVIKYIAKFCIMYTQVNKIKNDDEFESIKRVYEQAREEMVKTEIDLPQYKQLVHKLKAALEKHTNFKQIEAAVTSI